MGPDTELDTTNAITAAARADGEVTELSVSGMTCGNCARHVREAIQSVSGVASAAVALERNRATVRWAAGSEPDVPGLVAAVEGAGFGARFLEPEASPCAEPAAAAVWLRNVLTGVIPTGLLMLGEWVFRLGMEPWYRWASFFLALVVQVGPGSHFYRGAWRQLKARSSNMDTLVALGSTTAFAYSAWVLFSGRHDHLYFMEAAAIISLISLGHWLEARVSARASSSLRALLTLAPAMARRRNAEGRDEEVPAGALRPGDTVVLRPGDRVPTDGQVREGSSAVDESMLTGESIPVDKQPGDELYAGTVVSDGHLVQQVTATGEATALARIIAAVERAATSRARIQRLGDRVSSVFVPIVVLIALATGLWWGLAFEQANAVNAWLAQYFWKPPPVDNPLAAAFITAAAVLIVACPCAMGLATPAAIMAGSNAAAERGILIRDALALEKAGDLTAVMFDKTGTLTAGRPTVAAFQALNAAGFESREAAVRLAAALARRSNHPLSQAVAGLSPGDLEVADWLEVRGAGVQGRVRVPGGSRNEAEATGEVPAIVRLGAWRWLAECGVEMSAGAAFVEEWSPKGATILGLSVGNKLAGAVALHDSLKDRAAEVVSHLTRQGMKAFLVTGDHARTAQAIARQVGIPPEHVLAEIRPEQKARLVQQFQERGERVAFVGDGINDAPALEQADLGIAVSRASDIAREAADIILLKSEIEAVPESLGLARATLRTIRQNLFWAFFYNAASIPLAALGFMSPVLCAAAMGFSDMIVLGNALRLRRWRLPG